MKKVLIIEDEQMLAEMYKDKFEDEGFAVSLAYDGEQGVEKALQEEPDILILDILLPGKEGLEVLGIVRKSGLWGRKVPVIMLTNLDSDDRIIKAIEKYRPSYYFIKSNTELEEITDRAKELIK